MLKLLLNCLVAQAVLVSESVKNIQGNSVFQREQNTNAMKTCAIESNTFDQDDDSKEFDIGELDESMCQ